MSRGKRAAIFALSFFVTLVLLYAGTGIKKRAVSQKMAAYAAATARESDGAENLLLLNGESGYVGPTNVYLKYQKDGSIRLSGSNPGESNGWKLLCEFELAPGEYTLTGLSGFAPKTVELQYSVWNEEKGGCNYYSQHDADIVIRVNETSSAWLHVRVYPFAEETDANIRPAVYKDA